LRNNDVVEMQLFNLLQSCQATSGCVIWLAFIISCVVICSSFNLRVVGVLAMTYHVTDELCTVTVRTMVGVRVFAVWKKW